MSRLDYIYKALCMLDLQVANGIQRHTCPWEPCDVCHRGAALWRAFVQAVKEKKS